MNQEYLLKAEHITKRFNGAVALNDVQIDISAGEIHALVGENGAGKSTLMNIIGGVFHADSGNVLWNGQEICFRDPQDALEYGIGFVHQELALCHHLTVAENIYIGRLPTTPLGVVNVKKLNSDAAKCLKQFKIAIDPEARISDLTNAERQIVEIAKAISANCKLIIFDEPTSSLTDREAETLFGIIKDLRDKGVSILYISHRMSEIFDLSDRITIFRDGQYVGTKLTAETNVQEIVSCMVGREIEKFYPPKSKGVGNVILEVKNFTCGKKFKNIDFSVREAEILGISGLIGAGRTEVVRAICGIDPHETGEVLFHGKPIVIKNYHHAIENGIAYLSEDRKLDGLFLNMSVLQNVCAAKLKNISNGILISKKKEQGLSERYIRELNIRVNDPQQKIESLSGGNQQKVMLSKWLSVAPKVLFLDEPTRGIDVGAKAEIYGHLRELSNAGVGIVVISSDLPEIIGLCDRVVVMCDGIKTGEASDGKINEKDVMMMASGQTEAQKNSRIIEEVR